MTGSRSCTAEIDTTLIKKKKKTQHYTCSQILYLVMGLIKKPKDRSKNDKRKYLYKEIT